MSTTEITLYIPDDLFEWLKSEAEKNQRTISDLIIEILETRRLFDEGSHK